MELAAALMSCTPQRHPLSNYVSCDMNSESVAWFLINKVYQFLQHRSESCKQRESEVTEERGTRATT
eukprot:871471-Amphidinium_carterae.1